MNVHPPRAALATNLTIPFQAVGGTPPYSYSKIKGIGSIDSISGIYSSPSGTGMAIIRAVDSSGAIDEAEILIASPLQLLCDILQQEMGLEDGRVYLWDEKINKPKDQGLFIAVAEISCKPFSNVRKMQADGSTFQSTNFYSRLDISVISRDTEARDRRAETLMALNSFYCETQQSLNSFRVYPLTTSFVNLSEGDGSAIPYRYVLSIAMSWAQSKVTDTPYFDTFQTLSPIIDDSGKTASAND